MKKIILIVIVFMVSFILLYAGNIELVKLQNNGMKSTIRITAGATEALIILNRVFN